MRALSELIACAGRWTGTNVLEDPHNEIAAESPSTATVTPLLDGRFVRIDYTWTYEGKPQEGSMLIGFRAAKAEATLHWIDSWHNSDNVMQCTGTRRDDGTLDVRGSYGAPTGPDWGWRTEIVPDGPDTLRWIMYNVSPEGAEYLAVTETLSRA